MTQGKISLQRPYFGVEELEAVKSVLESRWLGAGAYTSDFENRLQELLGATHVLAVNTGTSALHLALDACGIGNGDEVIVPSLTFIASAQAVLATGARPVFCEVHPETLNMDVSDAASRITDRTRAVMPVHFGGLPCDMDELLTLGRKKNIFIIEDAAHAFGSSYKGRKIGTLGNATCFSFDPIKNITCGEGGAIATEDDKIARRIHLRRTLGLSNSGWDRFKQERFTPYEVTEKGYRYHLSNINAAIGLQQLKRLEVFKKRKQEIAAQYRSAFANASGLRMVGDSSAETFPFFFVIRVLGGLRNPLMNHLNEYGITTGVHYIPNHLQPLFAESKVKLPVTEALFEEILTIPLYYEMTQEEVERVILAIQSFFHDR